MTRILFAISADAGAFLELTKAADEFLSQAKLHDKARNPSVFTETRERLERALKAAREITFEDCPPEKGAVGGLCYCGRYSLDVAPQPPSREGHSLTTCEPMRSDAYENSVPGPYKRSHYDNVPPRYYGREWPLNAKELQAHKEFMSEMFYPGASDDMRRASTESFAYGVCLERSRTAEVMRKHRGRWSLAVESETDKFFRDAIAEIEGKP